LVVVVLWRCGGVASSLERVIKRYIRIGGITARPADINVTAGRVRKVAVPLLKSGRVVAIFEKWQSCSHFSTVAANQPRFLVFVQSQLIFTVDAAAERPSTQSGISAGEVNSNI
jgi:hypothetical protein